jgi:hypothetical protein
MVMVVLQPRAVLRLPGAILRAPLSGALAIFSHLLSRGVGSQRKEP